MSASGTAEMLREHNLFRTTDLAEARDQVARVFCPHRLVTTSRSGRVDTVHNRLTLDELALNYLDYGAEVSIDPGPLTSFFLVQIPLAGGGTITCGKSTIESTPALASVPSPTEHLSMVWHDDSPHVLVYIPRVTAEERLRALLGVEVIAPLRFDLGMDMTTEQAMSWRRLVDLAISDADAGGVTMQQPVRKQLEDLILTGLLLSHRHNYTEALNRDYMPCAPRVIREALNYADLHGDRVPTMTELAGAAGVSIRSLQASFLRYTGMSPTAYLRDLRLQRVRRTLQDAHAVDVTVAGVAQAWGFTHLGRFAASYAKRFGELPSQTLRQ